MNKAGQARTSELDAALRLHPLLAIRMLDRTHLRHEIGGLDQLARDLAMHVAALAPQFATRDSVSAKALADEREIARAKAIAAVLPRPVSPPVTSALRPLHRPEP